MLAKQWLDNARDVMSRIEETQMENIRKAAEVMADSAIGEDFGNRCNGHPYTGNEGHCRDGAHLIPVISQRYRRITKRSASIHDNIRNLKDGFSTGVT